MLKGIRESILRALIFLDNIRFAQAFPINVINVGDTLVNQYYYRAIELQWEGKEESRNPWALDPKTVPGDSVKSLYFTWMVSVSTVLGAINVQESPMKKIRWNFIKRDNLQP